MARHAPAPRFQGLPWTPIILIVAGAMAIGAVILVALGTGEAVTPPVRTTAALPTAPSSYSRPVVPSIGASGAWDPSDTSPIVSPSTVTVVETVTVSPRLTSPPPPRPPAAPAASTVTETQTVTETATVTVTETVTIPPPIIEEIP